MKNPQIFNKLAKSRGARMVTAYAVILLVMQPYALAMDQIVNKYPSDYYVQPQDIGNAHPLDIGSVFNFNNSKAPSTICLKPGEPGYPQAGCTDNVSLSEIDENNCDPESTVFTFDMGDDGWEGIRPPNQVPPATENLNLKYVYDASNYALKVNLTKKNQTVPFVYEKKFFYECGTPGMSDFKMRYTVPNPVGINTTAGTNYFKVDLIKPLGGVINLIASTNFSGNVAWTWKPGPSINDTVVIPTTNWNESGVYTIRISGQLRTLTSGAPNINILFDDISLNKTSLWTDYRHDVEYFVKAAPYSQLGGAGNGYTLEVKAAKKTSGADNVNVLVYNGASWTTKGQITQTYNDTLPQNNLQVLSIPLSDAEYNNGLVRVRYVDATQSGDTTPGGLYVDYQRIKVDQGICVQEVRSIEADCGKCHNYGGDVTKPWPMQGMHNKHAQTESVSDCAWCHPDVTVGGTVFPSDHMNGVQDGRNIEIAGTKIYRSGGANPQGATGVWDPATGRCTTSDCHNNITTPAWTATYGATNGELNGVTVIARNCSRCHNKGAGNSTPDPDDVSDLNINVAWPNTLAHNEHNNAFAMDENSCQANGSCHPDNRGQHTQVKDVDGVSTLMSPKYQSPSGSGVKYIKTAAALPGDGDGRCYNATCHGGQETPKWNAAVGSLDPAQGNAYCKACHKGEKATTWTPGATLPDISAKQYNSPISGLHQGSPPTSGKSHVSEYGCAVCHVSNPSKHFKDLDGTTNLDTPFMDPITPAELVTTMGYAPGTGTPPSYTSGTPPTCATPFPGPNSYTCHAESDTTSAIGKLSGTATPWARDWSWDAYDTATPANQCKVCHGVYGSFKNLRPAHTSTKLQGNHSDSGVNCGTTCHAQTDNETVTTTNVYNHGVAMTADAKTIDVSMTNGFTQYPTAMETTLSTSGLYAQQYVMQTGTTDSVGCSGCHDNGQTLTNFRMQESGWKLRNQITGPAPACASDSAGCHGNAATGQIWPNGSTYPDRDARHQLHISKLAAKLGFTPPGTEAEQKSTCTYCHNTLSPGLAGHTSDATANQAEVSGFKRIWNATADATGTAASYSTTDGSCTGIDCHNNKTAAAGTFGWRNASTTTCTMCHTAGGTNYDPTSGLHNMNASGVQKHDGSTAPINGCTACHLATPPSSHIDGVWTVNGATNGITERFVNSGLGYAETAVTSGRSGSCSGAGVNIAAGCHTDNGTWSRLWSTEADSADTVTAVGNAKCNVCHGQWSSIAGSAGWAAGTSHYKAGTVANGVNTPGNTRGAGHEPTTPSCANCHAYLHANYTGKHDSATHRVTINTNNNTGYERVSTNAGCNNGACHGGAADSTKNFPISYYTQETVSGTAFPAPSCTSCHDSGAGGAPVVHSVTGTHIKANGTTFVGCEECHAKHADATAAGANVIYVSSVYTGTTAVPTMTKADGTTALYSTHSYKIRLGGTATNGACNTKSTEAEWCWACHDSQTTKVTEWRDNPSADTGNSTYDYGRLFTDASTVPGTETSNWTTGYWRSGKGLNSTLTTNPFWYKRGKVRSTHSANYDGTTATSDSTKTWKGSLTNTASGYSTTYNKGENLDTAANIRCSYCHDVHGTHNGTKGDNSGTAGPYLRGTWIGNLYAEDGAPRYGMSTFTNQLVSGSTTNAYGAVPRGSADPNNTGLSGVAKVGGFWIDQNSDNPTGTITGATALDKATNSSGLCEQCHGANKTGTWTAAAIGSLDQITGEALWVSAGNGHANSVIGATGVTTTAANIFNRTRRGNATVDGFNVNTGKDAVDMGLATIADGTYGTSYRMSTSETSGYRWKPWVANSTEAGTTVSRSYAYRAFAWNSTSYITSTRNFNIAAGTSVLYVTNEPEATTETAHNSQANYHTFTCSKCHNPHASRLPKLMITNCLDTNHNTWEDKNTFTQGQTGSPAIGTPWSGLRHSQWASAQNCHRLDARATNAGTTTVGTGWTTVTPWIEDTAPNPASGSGKTADLTTLPTY